MRTFRLKAKPASSILSSITGVLFYGFWAFAAFAAQAFLANDDNRRYFDPVMAPVLLVMFAYWQLIPVVTATMGASLDLKKLLAYPIPHGQLFFVEVMLRVTTCLEMLLMLAGISVGVLRNPRLGGLSAFPRVAVTALLFAAINLLLSAGLRSLIERLLRRRKVREAMLFLLVAVSVVPQFLVRSKFAKRNIDLDGLQRWMTPFQFFPWGAVARIFLNEEIWRPLAVLAAFAAGAYVFGRAQFKMGLRFDGESKNVRAPGAPIKEGIVERIVRFPSRFLPDPIGAVFEKETVSLARMAPFRMLFLMGSSLGVLLCLPNIMSGKPGPGFMTGHLLAMASGYGILMLGQVTYFNCFGFDRSATQTWFSLPVPIVKTLVAKNLAAAFFMVAETGMTLIVTWAFRVPLTGLKIAESFCVCAIAAVYLISFGNITSTRIPRALNPDRVSQGGSSKAMNALATLCFPLVLAPVGIAYWGRSVFQSEAVFFGLLGLAAVFGAVLYWVAMGSASDAANTRREKMLDQLSRGDGPVSAA